MLDLFERREPIDIVTVSEALERSGDLEGIGGRAYLGTLSNQTPTAVHAVQYARIVERKALLRNLIGAAGKIAGIGYEDPAEVQRRSGRVGDLRGPSRRSPPASPAEGAAALGL
jgi:replicative DNA helicase